MNRRQCAVCDESEPSFIHTVSKNGVFRRLCTDCLLKEHRDFFCPVCLNVFAGISPPQQSRLLCLNCPSITHLSCSPPSSSTVAAAGFTCPPCSDPNFSFFPRSRLPISAQNGANGENGDGGSKSKTVLNVESVKALVAAANIAAVSMSSAAAKLKNEAVKKIMEARTAKMRAKAALGNLHDIVLRQNQANPNKRKNTDL
ncbi:unnamed protein product [Cochlearia groenlandica]